MSPKEKDPVPRTLRASRRQQNESVSVKLGDFGLAFGPEGQLSGGSWLYFSPETAAAILAVEEADFVEMQFEKLAKADVWAAGRPPPPRMGRRLRSLPGSARRAC